MGKPNLELNTLSPAQFQGKLPQCNEQTNEAVSSVWKAVESSNESVGEPYLGSNGKMK